MIVPYLGEKSKFANFIVPNIPTNISTYVEPFGGMMGIFFALDFTKYKDVDFIYNDKNNLNYLLFKNLQNNIFIDLVNSTEVDEDYYNRWSVEFDLGQSKGAKPYTEGYYSSEADKFFGGFQINHYGLGLRYMLNPKFGIKGRFAYDDIKNLNGSESLKFKLQHYQFRL